MLQHPNIIRSSITLTFGTAEAARLVSELSGPNSGGRGGGGGAALQRRRRSFSQAGLAHATVAASGSPAPAPATPVQGSDGPGEVLGGAAADSPSGASRQPPAHEPSSPPHLAQLELQALRRLAPAAPDAEARSGASLSGGQLHHKPPLGPSGALLRSTASPAARGHHHGPDPPAPATPGCGSAASAPGSPQPGEPPPPPPAQEPPQQQPDQLLPLHSSSRRNIDDLAAGPSAFNTADGEGGTAGSLTEEGHDTGPGSLVTWIVMDFADKGPLSSMACRMAGDAMERKLVGGRSWLGSARCWSQPAVGAGGRTHAAVAAAAHHLGAIMCTQLL